MRTQPITLLAATALLVGSVACLDVAERATGPLSDAPEVVAATPPGSTPADVIYAGVLERITGKRHSIQDVRQMGMAAVQVVMSRDLLQRSERELADLRAAGSRDAERIEELERQIASSRSTLAWMADFMSAGSPLADGDVTTSTAGTSRS